MSLYYTYGELDKLLDDVMTMSPTDPVFMRIIMKIVCSFGKERILTEAAATTKTAILLNVLDRYLE